MRQQSAPDRVGVGFMPDSGPRHWQACVLDLPRWEDFMNMDRRSMLGVRRCIPSREGILE
jgi:hypothetical protein